MAIYNCPQCGAILPYSGAACSSCARKRADEQRWRNQSSNLSSYVSNGSSSTSNRSSSHSSSCSYEKVIDKLSETITKLDKVLSFTGYKKQSFSDGSYYEGDFVNGKFHGKGKYTWADGNVYVGDWVEDCRHGKGTLRWKDGDVYVGDWVKNARTGKGKYTYADGDCYEGYFVNGEANGYGKYTYADGAVYEGEFKNNMSHGKGKLTDADGETYEGEFKEGERHGRGKCVLPDGMVQDGYFENGEFVGAAGSAYEDDDEEMDVSPEVDEEIDISPEVLEKFKQSETVTTSQPAAQNPEQEIWDRLLSMSTDEKQAYFKEHHEVTIPAGTEAIPANCFRTCFDLHKVNFNEELREIGEYAFASTRIESVLVIPKSVEKIANHAFDMSRTIEKVVLPNNITVGDYAFAFINDLAEVEFESEPPQGVVIGRGAFARCNKHSMKSKEMINKIEELNKKAFK